MTNETYEPGMNRRSFLKGAALTAVAATVTGAGAAVLTKQDSAPVIEAITSSSSPPSLPIATLTSQPTTAGVVVQPAGAVPTPGEELLANLAQSQAENMRLQAELDGLRRELDSLTMTGQEQQAAREALALELDQANGRIGILGGLVALYEQLDGLDVGELLSQGLGSVSSQFGELFDQTPLLADGIQSSELALAEVEAHLPLLENGRQWLDAQVNKVEGFYGEVEAVLREVVEAVGSFLEMLGNWFESLKRWLPFGVGEKAVGVMSALTTLVAETPNTLSGLNTNVAQPLDVWLAHEEDGPALQRKLIKPIREQVFTRAADTLARTETVKTTYQTQLVEPVQVALDNRKAVRDQIIAYRQQDQL
jgi:hypothetical protein